MTQLRGWRKGATAALLATLTAGTLAACSSSTDTGGGSSEAPETTQVQLLLPANLGLNWAAYLVAQERFWPEMGLRSEEHTSELQSLMRISYAVFCLTKKNQ